MPLTDVEVNINIKPTEKKNLRKFPTKADNTVCIILSL